MARYYPGMSITLTTENRNSAGTLANNSTLRLIWKLGRFGQETTVTPTNTGTGLYSATVTPTEPGTLFYRWETTDTDAAVAAEGQLNIAWSEFAP